MSVSIDTVYVCVCIYLFYSSIRVTALTAKLSGILTLTMKLISA